MDTKTDLPSPLINLADLSLWAVIGGNLLSIILATLQSWPMGEVMWVYWAQSIIIGILNVFRMLSLKEFSTEGMIMNNKPVPENEAGKTLTAVFFAVHYGFFHFVYAVFLWNDMPLSDLSTDDLMLMALCIVGFFAAHKYSLGHNAKSDFKQKRPNLSTLMFYPYLRIIPMHFTIILGGTMGGAMVIFMVLKTVADAGMHMVEHHIFKQPEKKRSGWKIKKTTDKHGSTQIFSEILSVYLCASVVKPAYS